MSEPLTELSAKFDRLVAELQELIWYREYHPDAWQGKERADELLPELHEVCERVLDRFPINTW